MSQQTATQCSPAHDLGSILRSSPLPPLGRVRYAAQLLLGHDMDALATSLGVGRPHLYRVIQGDRHSPPLRQRLAALLGVDVGDIWPGVVDGEAAMAGNAS